MLIISVISAGAAGSYFLSEGFYYGVNQREAYIHGYAGEESDVVIREKFLNNYVTSVEEFAFFQNETVRTVSFYDATRLRSLGQCAFAGCINLLYAEIPNTIAELGASVFDGCTSLRYVRFCEGSASSIPAQAFYECTSLNKVVFENEVTEIGAYAFASCASLSEIEIPDSVVHIADNAFSGCDELVIRCHTDSYAMQYAIDNDIDYVLTDAMPALLGDADCDGQITIIDATTIRRMLIMLYVPKFNEAAADVDGNGPDITDATWIQRYIAELTVPYPIGEPISETGDNT